MKWALWVLLPFLVLGCSNRPTSSPNATATSPATSSAAQDNSKSAAEGSNSWTDEEKRIAEIARKAVGANNSILAKQSEIGKPFKHADGSWAVVIWRLPAVPGGETYVDIDANGKVVSITGGM